jgi:hypothetical protein
MEDFKPSGSFVANVMREVRIYEASTREEKRRLDSFLLSKPVFSILAAGGVLFGVINLVRMALIVISPAACL